MISGFVVFCDFIIVFKKGSWGREWRGWEGVVGVWVWWVF